MMRAGGPGVTAVDLRRYSDAIDWTRPTTSRLFVILHVCSYAYWADSGPIWRASGGRVSCDDHGRRCRGSI
jgi:hypothetical protein